MTDLRFDAGGRDLAALRLGTPGGRRVLALHGWLDNAASFLGLAAELPHYDWVALDFAGHGHSARRPPGGWYPFIDHLDDVSVVLDALGWERCTLIGHSMGGAVASVFAAAWPERVERLVMIESAGPVARRNTGALEQLLLAMRERAAYEPGRRRTFPDTRGAILARRQAGGLSEPVARLLMERNLEAASDDVSDPRVALRVDPRLRIASPSRFDEDTVRAWMSGIACPVLGIAADPPFPGFDPQMRAERLACIPDGRIVELPGNHHLHMEAPKPVAEAIRAFLDGSDQVSA